MTAERRKLILRVVLGLGAAVAAAFFFIVFLVNFWGLNSFDKMTDRVKQATPEQWHAWAAHVIERSKTNSDPIPRSEWPDFARRITTTDAVDNWELHVERGDSNTAPHIMLFSLGGFQSIGVDIGSSSFVKSEGPESSVAVKQIYPGVYVRRSR